MGSLPSFMIANILELLGVLVASILIAIFSTLIIDRNRIIRKVQLRVLNLRLIQYDCIREFIKEQSEVKIFPENCKIIKENLEIYNILLKDNDDCCSSIQISSHEKIKATLFKLENISMNGLYVLDDDVLGLILQIKIYVKNLNFLYIFLSGYYSNKDYFKDEDIEEISKFYFHQLSILLNNEYQSMIKKLHRLIAEKSSKPKFEFKEKDYRRIKTRQRIQERALEKTILRNDYLNLIHGLASLCSTHFNETEEETRNTTKDFFEYAINILKWNAS